MNERTALRGDAPHACGRFKVRPWSLESQGVLELVGSPFAAVMQARLNRQPVPEIKGSHFDVFVFAWAHVEDPDVVLAVALECLPGFAAPAITAAVKFLRDVPDEEMRLIMAALQSDGEAYSAADFDVTVPRELRSKKKA